MKYLFMLMVILGLVACDKAGSIDGTKERAAAESQAGTEADNQNQANKAERMEADLTTRHQVYAALEGVYEGTLVADSETYNIKMTLSRSIQPYTGDRVRQLSEIEADINNLYFYIQVLQWHPQDSATAVGCRVSGIRPNILDGTITIATSECPNLYSIYSSDAKQEASVDRATLAKQLVEQVKQGVLADVPNLVGTIQPSSNAGVFNFKMTKKPRGKK